MVDFGDLTIREAVLNLLESKGIWDQDREDVMDRVIEGIPEMEGRWDKECSSYDFRLFAVLSLSVNRIVVEWIDSYRPNHFARPLFVDQKLV